MVYVGAHLGATMSDNEDWKEFLFWALAILALIAWLSLLPHGM